VKKSKKCKKPAPGFFGPGGARFYD